MGEPDVVTTLDEERRAIARREQRLDLPAVALSEWCELHSVQPDTAKGWVSRGIFPGGAVWKSGRDHLIRPREPVPVTRPGPRPKKAALNGVRPSAAQENDMNEQQLRQWMTTLPQDRAGLEALKITAQAAWRAAEDSATQAVTIGDLAAARAARAEADGHRAQVEILNEELRRRDE